MDAVVAIAVRVRTIIYYTPTDNVILLRDKEIFIQNRYSNKVITQINKLTIIKLTN